MDARGKMRPALKASVSAQHAERIWRVLAEAAAAGERPTYEQVAGRLGRKKTLWLISSLDAIQNYCIAKRLPPLTSIVVNKATGRPGEGYLGHAQDVEAAWRKVRRHDWTRRQPDALALDAHRAKKKRRDWTEAEVTMAAHLYINRGPIAFPTRDSIRRLAALLRRTEGSVSLKIANIQSIDPSYLRSGGTGMPNTGPLDEVVFNTWRHDPQGLVERYQELSASFTGQALDHSPTAQEAEPPVWTMETAAAAIQAATEVVDPSRRSAKVRDAAKQQKFNRGVHAALWKATRGKLPKECPGCGHARTLANGSPVFDACHIIAWKTTGSFDYRWGIPLCPNCHRISEFGTADEQRRIFRSATTKLPHLLENLRSLMGIGKVSAEQLEQISSMGIKV